MSRSLIAVCLVIISSITSPITCSDFKSIPTTVKTYENDTVLLPCYLEHTDTSDVSVTGRTVRVRWHRDGQLIGDSGQPAMIPPERVRLWGNGSIEVSHVQNEDTGEYTCEVIRPPPWSPVKQHHAIEVLYPPSVIPDPISGYLQVRLGDEVRISCKADGVPYPLITWARNGEEMQLLDNREMLKFDASSRHLGGFYECVATNGVGTPASAKIEVNVIYPPEVSTDTAWMHTSPGLRVQLKCNIAADPEPQVEWLKSDLPVQLNSRVVRMNDGDNHILLIRNVRISDFGIYKCRASNNLGTAEMSIQLSGVARPGTFKKVEQKVKKENSYTLVWEVDSYTPIIEYSLWFRPYRSSRGAYRSDWSKLTIPAEHSPGPIHSKSYTIKGLKEKTVYEAMLVSRNRYGWSKPSQVVRFSIDGTEIEEDAVTQIHVQPPLENVVPIEYESTQTSDVQKTAICTKPLLMLLLLLLYLINK